MLGWDLCAKPGDFGLWQDGELLYIWFPVCEMGMIAEPTWEGIVAISLNQALTAKCFTHISTFNPPKDIMK